MTVRVSPIAAASFAETRARSRLGMAMAAMIPMMATTINSSINVNPFWVFKSSLLSPSAADTNSRLAHGR
jgi:hypothetical protein